MYRSLLVPLDGTLFAEQALSLALNIARSATASLHVVTVGSPEDGVLTHYLERTVERLRQQIGPGSIALKRQFLQGDGVAPTICDYVDRAGIDLVVMRTHGRGTLGRLFLGSVGYEIMEQSPAPLLFIPPGTKAPAAHQGPRKMEWGPDQAIRHVLIMLDGSVEGEQILEPALALGKLLDADYTLDRVISSIPRGTQELDPISLSSPAMELNDEIRLIWRRQQQQAQDYLDTIMLRLKSRDVQVRTRVTSVVDIESGILDESSAPAIDLVAVGRHESQEFSDQIPESMARQIIHGTNKAVLVQTIPSERPARV
jgi:nucleotide-binding universal stress UspA family protein